MNKTIKLAACAIASAAMFVSCTTTTPISATSNPVGNKCGEASASRILSFIGGSSNIGINAAAKNGGITRISHVDFVQYNFLGLYQKFTTRVYGE